jgi:hypothetical protein
MKEKKNYAQAFSYGHVAGVVALASREYQAKRLMTELSIVTTNSRSPSRIP